MQQHFVCTNVLWNNCHFKTEVWTEKLGCPNSTAPSPALWCTQHDPIVSAYCCNQPKLRKNYTGHYTKPESSCIWQWQISVSFAPLYLCGWAGKGDCTFHLTLKEGFQSTQHHWKPSIQKFWAKSFLSFFLVAAWLGLGGGWSWFGSLFHKSQILQFTSCRHLDKLHDLWATISLCVKLLHSIFNLQGKWRS